MSFDGPKNLVPFDGPSISCLETWVPKIDFENHILALFDSSPLIQNSKFNKFLWVCWFLGKNLSNFVSPIWKLHNPYCNNQGYPNKHFYCSSQFIGFSKVMVLISFTHLITVTLYQFHFQIYLKGAYHGQVNFLAIYYLRLLLQKLSFGSVKEPKWCFPLTALASQ